MKLSVIIPAYNEAARLPAYLQEVKTYLEGAYPSSHEIIVVDDGSQDTTSQVVTAILGPKALIRHPQNRGKGAAVRTGMLAAHGSLKLFADADGATPIAEEARLAAAIAAGSDLAIGSRAARGGRRVYQLKAATHVDSSNDVVWHVYPHRHVIGRIYSLLVRSILGLSYSDTQCGFKMFTDRAAKAIFEKMRCDNFAFDVEALHVAALNGLRVAEVAVSWHEVDGSRVRLAADSWRMLRALLAIRRHDQPCSQKAKANEP